MVATSVHRSPVPNPDVLREGDRPGEFLVSEVSNYGCRENVEITAGDKDIPHNSVVVPNGGKFDAAIIFEGVKAGQTVMRGAIVRGLCEVSLAKLRFPEAPDGPDAGTDTVAETAALRELLIDALKSAGIVVRA